MKKVNAILIVILMFGLMLTGCGANQKTSKINKTTQGNAVQTPTANNTKENSKVESAEEIKAKINSMYKNLYIGELFKSGFTYIEPFSINREINNNQINLSGYSNSAKLYPILQDTSNKFYEAVFSDKYSKYVPNTEKESKYFSQEFSKPNQFGLRYKLNKVPRETSIAIAIFNQEVINSDYSVKGRKRPYSQNEYNNALNEVKKDKEVPQSSRTLSNISLDSTIIGAQELCLYSIKDTDIKILLSEYNTHDAEYVSDVYVVDFIRNGKVIQTYEKKNTDGPY